jgi:hypothetical protein
MVRRSYPVWTSDARKKKVNSQIGKRQKGTNTVEAQFKRCDRDLTGSGQEEKSPWVIAQPTGPSL